MRSGLGHLALNLRHHTAPLVGHSSEIRGREGVPVARMIGVMESLPARIRLVIFDLDGVVYRGSQPVEGAADLVRWLHERGIAVRFATNNSMVAREGYVDRLGAMGIATSVDEIVTSTSATVVHLRLHAPHVRRVLAIGADGMRRELEAAGLAVDMAADVPQDRPGAPLGTAYDAVVVGLDPGFDYHRLAVATSAVTAGAALVATNADARYPTPDGFLPGAGSMVAAVAAASGAVPEIIGKPEPAMFRAIMEAAAIPGSETVVVGDNPASDVIGARRAGCAAILVLTGVADAASVGALQADAVPHAVAADPAGVRVLLEPLIS
jgi:HAD superfamily hydrolase (TIGR01450 family)